MPDSIKKSGIFTFYILVNKSKLATFEQVEIVLVRLFSFMQLSILQNNTAVSR
jgi:hypothetical protein